MMATMRAVLACGALLLAGCEASADHQAARPLSSGNPVYPRDEEIHGRQGTAIIACGITETGVTRDCTVEAATAPDFGAAGLAYAAKARYEPATENGHPVAVKRHTYAFHFTMPPRTFTLDALCSVRASGRVHDCRLANRTGPTSWPTLKAALERSEASPSFVDGKAVDQTDRPVSLMVAFGRLPLTDPLPEVPGDSFLSMTVACDPVAPGAPARSRCVEVTGAGDAADQQGRQRVAVRVGIVGLVSPDTGDFSR